MLRLHQMLLELEHNAYVPTYFILSFEPHDK